MSLCLNMIVKDESHIIETTLQNICQHFPITYWAICDTGSSDNTIELIEQFLRNKASMDIFIKNLGRTLVTIEM